MDDPLPDPQTDPSFEDLSDVESSEEEVDNLFATDEVKEETKSKVTVDSYNGSDNDSDRDSHNDSHNGSQNGSHSKTSNKNSKKLRKRVLKKDPKKNLNKDLVCSQCKPNRHFKKHKILDLHKKVLHSMLPSRVCLWCAKKFFTKNQLAVHQTLYAHNKPID